VIFHYAGITFEQYKLGKTIMTFLLGPATVGLALPLYQNRNILRTSCIPILVGIACGSIATLTTAVVLAKLSGLDSRIVASIATKSICPANIGSHHQGPKRTCTSKSPINHHS
jgi:putative effector of murein hydrolase